MTPTDKIREVLEYILGKDRTKPINATKINEAKALLDTHVLISKDDFEDIEQFINFCGWHGVGVIKETATTIATQLSTKETNCSESGESEK